MNVREKFVPVTSIADVLSLVDRLGAVKAQIADLAKAEGALKKELTARGVGAYEGTLFRATVTIADRETLDMEAVCEKLSPQFITAHTRVTPVTTVRVVAKTGE